MPAACAMPVAEHQWYDTWHDLWDTCRRASTCTAKCAPCGQREGASPQKTRSERTGLPIRTHSAASPCTRCPCPRCNWYRLIPSLSLQSGYLLLAYEHVLRPHDYLLCPHDYRLNSNSRWCGRVGRRLPCRRFGRRRRKSRKPNWNFTSTREVQPVWRLHSYSYACTAAASGRALHGTGAYSQASLFGALRTAR